MDSEFQKLPVLPLRQAVIFPGTPTLIRAGRPGTLNAIEEALKGNKLVFAVSQRDREDEVLPENLATIGTIARIEQLQRRPVGLHLLVHGESRGIVVKYSESEDTLHATVRVAEELPPPMPEDPTFLALVRELKARALELGEKSGLPESFVQDILNDVKDPGLLADLVANSLEVEGAEKQEILGTLSIEQRLRQVLLHVQKQIRVLDAQKDIQSHVEKELGQRQREVLLREQLKAIRKELGEDAAADELDELKKRLSELLLPEKVRKDVERELSRLDRMGREGMEAQVIRSFLETVVELPWDTRSDDHIDLEKAAQILDEDHYGLSEVKDRVLEFLAVRQLRLKKSEAPKADDSESTVNSENSEAIEPESRSQQREQARKQKGPILLFAGPPGVGKTSIAKSIARSLGREYLRISLGGVRDEADIRGHRRTYVGAMPGRIIQAMRQAGTKNPVILLDEVDKLVASSVHGSPSSALLEVLDPAQNDNFVDHYLGVPFDLSEVLFIATANFVERIPGPLLDRMEAVSFRGYTEAEKLAIAQRYIVPRQLEANALTLDELAISDDAIAECITYYTREAGVRQLERVLGKLARKVARKVASADWSPGTLAKGEVLRYLGRPKVHPERASLEDQVGVATGMYYTPVGGDIMFVETTTMPGKGRLTLTGQLGDVMKESAQAVWTYVRSKAEDYGLEDADTLSRDVHVHVPAGAVPKDGPSAGVTLATALMSTMTGQAVRRDLAMTGEITLTGRVLPVGGIKEKVLGAVRAGLKKILLPQDNAADLEDLPEEVRKQLTVYLVSNLSEVLDTALCPSDSKTVSADR